MRGEGCGVRWWVSHYCDVLIPSVLLSPSVMEISVLQLSGGGGDGEDTQVQTGGDCCSSACGDQPAGQCEPHLLKSVSFCIAT